MNDVFLKERQKALEKFLGRLVAHPFFSFDQDIKIFLTASDEVVQQGGEGDWVKKGAGRRGGGRVAIVLTVHGMKQFVLTLLLLVWYICAGFCSSLERDCDDERHEAAGHGIFLSKTGCNLPETEKRGR